MDVTILDSEGVTLVELMAVEERALWAGINMPILRNLRVRDYGKAPTPLDAHQTTAVFEQWRGDGVAVFRRMEA